MSASPVLLLQGETFHGRHGGPRNAFRYSVDYVMIEPEADQPAPRGFARNRRAALSVWDRDHGGPPGQGRGAPWAREVLEAAGVPAPARLRLLAQPRVLGHVFNPVSFWLAEDAEGGLRAVIAEVTNTFGDRHSYLCHHPDHRPILAADRLAAQKIFHVSPFQPVAGDYAFNFGIGADRVAIRIDYVAPEGGGVLATLAGPLRPLTFGAILRAGLRRPFGSRRVLALIHWQAVKLWWKGAAYRPRPAPPEREVS